MNKYEEGKFANLKDKPSLETATDLARDNDMPIKLNISRIIPSNTSGFKKQAKLNGKIKPKGLNALAKASTKSKESYESHLDEPKC
jgi:hypothetical protein